MKGVDTAAVLWKAIVELFTYGKICCLFKNINNLSNLMQTIKRNTTMKRLLPPQPHSHVIVHGYILLLYPFDITQIGYFITLTSHYSFFTFTLRSSFFYITLTFIFYLSFTFNLLSSSYWSFTVFITLSSSSLFYFLLHLETYVLFSIRHFHIFLWGVLWDSVHSFILD